MTRPFPPSSLVWLWSCQKMETVMAKVEGLNLLLMQPRATIVQMICRWASFVLAHTVRQGCFSTHHA